MRLATIAVVVVLAATPAAQAEDVLFFDDFGDGLSDGWLVESGTWSAATLSYCQDEDIAPGRSRTVDTFYASGGFRVSADTYLVERLSWRGRDVGWQADDDNYVAVRYVGHEAWLECHCYVAGELVYHGIVDAAWSEWVGSDELWHKLSIEVDPPLLSVWRDDELIFSTDDARLFNLPLDGYAYLQVWGSHSCFDNVEVVSLSEGPVEEATWGLIKALYSQ